MRAISREPWILLLVLFSACGGSVDVAEIDRGDAAATARDPKELDSACYDPVHLPDWEYHGPENNFFTPLPDTGCEYRFSGDENTCQGSWLCCGDEYLIRYERDASKQRSQAYWSMPDGPSMEEHVDRSELVRTEPPSLPEPIQPCPLLGQVTPVLSAAAVFAAKGFDYTPAWEEAVRKARGDTVASDALDPIPLGCTLSMADYGCQGRLTCADHEYEVRAGRLGELLCTRDGVVVQPFDDRQLTPNCLLETAGFLRVDQCFGPGWSPYFTYAAEKR